MGVGIVEMRAFILPRLSMLMTMAMAVFLLVACEDEPEQTRERLDDAIGQKEVQDLLRDEDEAGSPEQEEEGDDDEREQR